MQDVAYEQMRTMQASHWWWRGMSSLYRSALEGAVRNDPACFIIDIGCGSGANLDVLSGFGSVVGMDVSLKALRSIPHRPALGLVQARAEALPFRKCAFDLIALLAILEHVDNDANALGEAHRVARQGAIQILLTSAFMLLWSHHDKANNHYRRYRATQLDNAQRAAGWHVLYTSYVNACIFSVAVVMRLIQRLLHSTSDTYYDMGPAPWLLDATLEALLRAESWLIVQQQLRLPFGVDLFSVARRED